MFTIGKAMLAAATVLPALFGLATSSALSAERLTLPPPPSDTSCSNLVGYAKGGSVPAADLELLARKCNEHPRVPVCLGTREALYEEGYWFETLTCGQPASANPRPPAKQKAPQQRDSTCGLLATYARFRIPAAELESFFSRCSQHQNSSICEETKTILVGNGYPSEKLTCRDQPAANTPAAKQTPKKK